MIDELIRKATSLNFFSITMVIGMLSYYIVFMDLFPHKVIGPYMYNYDLKLGNMIGGKYLVLNEYNIIIFARDAFAIDIDKQKRKKKHFLYGNLFITSLPVGGKNSH